MTLPAREPSLNPEQGLIIVSCSRRKLVTTDPVPALDLYQGALVPHLRKHLGPGYRPRIRILSAEHGLLHPQDLVGTYDHQLRSHGQAHTLQHRVGARLTADLGEPVLRQVLVVLEPLYLIAAACLFDHVDAVGLTLLPDPGDWPGASAVLSRWGWL